MKCRWREVKRSPLSPVSSGEEDSIVIRKGPWKFEEDEVLLKHVNKYGPRDWSSLLSKGLLRRTGKSCRLRWVNKLRPNLKSGCKFSAEEERIVIELQSQLGNKWAKIATYLPGRTDNDVKNFWSSRQKRLARLLLRSQSQNSESKPKAAIANFISSSVEASHHRSQIGDSSSSSSSSSQYGNLSYYTNGVQEMMVPCSTLTDQSNIPNFSSNNSIDAQVISSQNLIPSDQYMSTKSNKVELHEVSLPESLSEFPLLSPKAEEELIQTLRLDFLSDFSNSDDTIPDRALVCDHESIPLPWEMPYSEPLQAPDSCKRTKHIDQEIKGECSTFLDEEPVTPDSLFDDLPADILDQIKPW